MRKYVLLLNCFLLLLALIIPQLKLSAQPENLIKYATLKPAYNKSDAAKINALLTEGTSVLWKYPDSALKLFQKAEAYSLNTRYADGVTSSLLNIAHVYASQGKYDSSFKCYKKAVIYAYYATNKSMLSRVYTDIATTYMIQSDYPQAARYYIAAINALKNNGLGESYSILYTYANLAYLQSKVGQQNLSLYYLDQAEHIARRKKYYGPLGFILNNKGEAYRAMNRPNDALNCFIEGLTLCKKDTILPVSERTEIVQSLYVSLGSLMLTLNQPEKAIGYLQQAMGLSNTTNPYYASIFPRYMLGKAFYKLKDYKQAEANLLPALQQANRINFREDMPDALKTLSNVYEATGHPDKALEQYKAYTTLKDSVLSEEKTQEVNQLEVKYRTAQKDKELAGKQLLILRQHNQLMRKNTWLLIYSLIVLLLLVAVLLMMLRFRNNQHRQHLQEEKIRNIASEIELIKQEEEIKVMQALMLGEERERERLAKELHDGIGGMLAAIQMQFSTLEQEKDEWAQKEKLEKLTCLLNETATEIRKTSHNLMPDAVLEHGLERALQLFCTNINSARILQIELQIHGISSPITKSAELNIYRTIQELVQNVVKHSYAETAVLQLTWQDDTILIIMEDNGVGFDTKVVSKGLGLQNIRSRIDSLGGNFSIDSVPGKGTISYIELPLSTLIHQSA